MGRHGDGAPFRRRNRPRERSAAITRIVSSCWTGTILGFLDPSPCPFCHSRARGCRARGISALLVRLPCEAACCSLNSTQDYDTRISVLTVIPSEAEESRLAARRCELAFARRFPPSIEHSIQHIGFSLRAPRWPLCLPSGRDDSSRTRSWSG